MPSVEVFMRRRNTSKRASRATHRDSGESNKVNQIVEALQRRILTGDIAVGSWLRHEALAEEFGTSRTPVREAIQILNSHGIVTIVRNRGARVNGHSSRDIKDLGEVRAELEGFAAELAAERINDEQLERLYAAWRGFKEALADVFDHPTQEGDAQAAARWGDANDEFHNVIVEASGNRQLIDTIADIHRRYPKNTSYVAFAGNSRLLDRNLDEHHEITDAIARNDGTSARRLMTAHLRASSAATARWAEDRDHARQ